MSEPIAAAEAFFARVAAAEMLHGWRLGWYAPESREGYCWRRLRIVRVGPANEDVRRLILHELAHALTPDAPGTQHHAAFWRVYRRLLDTYLPGTDYSASDRLILRQGRHRARGGDAPPAAERAV